MCKGDRLRKVLVVSVFKFVCLFLTFYLFFDWLGWVDPMTDVVVVGVLEAEVILLDDVHLVVDLLQQFLSGCLFLEK